MSFARTMAGLINTSGDVKASAVGDVGIAVYSTLDLLPSTGLTEGDQAYVSSTRRFYISNGSGWYNVALANASPDLTVSNGIVTLATDGSTPTVITLTATDSDNPLAAITYTVESDGSFGGLATLSQDSSVFTITPLSEDSATTTSSTLTFKASDGINFGTDTSAFSLTFGPDWSATPTESILRASDAQAGDVFGWSVSISGDGTYAIVGAKEEDAGGSDAGAAYIFTRSGSTWTQQAKITASDAQTGDYFGERVSINADGTYAIVGARYEDGGAGDPAINAGAAYIFSRSGSTWTEQVRLTADSVVGNDQYGWGVSINGDGSYAIVASSGDDTGGNATGAAYIYVRSGSTWTKQQKIQASDIQAVDLFGISVSISSDGTYAIVGSQREDGGVGDPISDAGAAYIFTRSGSTWTQQAKLVASDAQASDYFSQEEGVSISGDGSYAVVGLLRAGSNAGAAYVFTRSGSTWTQQQKLTASDAQTGDQFGRSVSIDSGGTHIVVGAQTANSDAGAAYIFKRNGSSWSEIRILTASDAKVSDNFGHGVSISSDGTYATIGAYWEDGGAGDPIVNSGAAYIYEAG